MDRGGGGRTLCTVRDEEAGSLALEHGWSRAPQYASLVSATHALGSFEHCFFRDLAVAHAFACFL